MGSQRAMGARVGRTLAESRAAVSAPRRPRPGAPNVVIIVLDDLGFAQFGCYGSDIATPNIDRLAEEGLRYNRFHVTAICGATRACLLTGRNHHAVGMGWLELPMGLPGYTGRIPKSAGTLSRLLRDAGYSTFAVGKWHLTPLYDQGPAGPFDRWPLRMGFDRYYGFLGAETSQWTPDLVCDNGFIDPPLAPDEGYHVTEDLASQAIRFVQDQQQAAPDKPFFLYFATGAMHSPHQVPSEWMEPYRSRYDDGWEAQRRRAFRNQQQLGVVPPGTVLTDRPPWVAAWDELSIDERRLFARQMEVYAGFLTHTDAQIGRVLDFLGRIDVLDNTIVMVLSDNGASADGGPHGALTAGGNFQVNNVASMLSHIDDLGGLRTYNHYAWGWAWAGNSPFRLWKHYTWLGGVRVPLIVKWPAGIHPEHNGHIRSQFCHAVDLMPTVLEATGVELPDVLDGVSQLPVDGSSLLATLDDAEHPSPRATQYFEMMGSRAIYHDGWKATTNHVVGVPAQRERVEGSHDFDADQWSLFNMARDFSEAHNLAAAHPKRLEQMVELWWYEAGRNQVLPLMDDIVQRFAAMEPPAHQPRDRSLPGAGSIVTPSITSGFRVAAEIELPKSDTAAGIICAQGDWNSGWACYILDGHLVVTFNFARTPTEIVDSEKVPSGRHKIIISYSPNPDAGGFATVAFDNRDVGAASVNGEPSWSTRRLLVGRDQGLPVCDDYWPPFPFTGQVHRVNFGIPKPKPSNAVDEIEAALRRD